MTIIVKILPFIQIILSLILIGAVLMQQSEAGLGGVLGGGDNGGLYHTRRGFEKFLFVMTITVAITLTLSSLLAVFIK